MLWGRSTTLHRLHDMIENSGETYTKSTIQKRPFLAKWARVSNPPDCPAAGLRPDRRRDQVAKRPNTGRTDARASVGRRHLLNTFLYQLRTRPRLSRAKRHGSKTGVLPVPGPMVFIFDFRPEKTMGPIGPAAGQRRRTVASTQCRRHPRARDPYHQHFWPETSVHPPGFSGFRSGQVPDLPDLHPIGI
jgi:hypothetical protein